MDRFEKGAMVVVAAVVRHLEDMGIDLWRKIGRLHQMPGATVVEVTWQEDADVLEVETQDDRMAVDRLRRGAEPGIYRGRLAGMRHEPRRQYVEPVRAIDPGYKPKSSQSGAGDEGRDWQART